MLLGAVMLVVLNGCVIVGTPSLQASFLSLTTNFYNGNDANPVYFICDNKVTTITYKFTYNDFSLFDGWSSQLRGKEGKQTAGLVSFNRNDAANDTTTRTVTVSYQVAAQATPLRVNPSSVSSQAIIITPVPKPSIIGNTLLDVLVRGRSGAADLTGTFGPIGVIDNCP